MDKNKKEAGQMERNWQLRSVFRNWWLELHTEDLSSSISSGSTSDTSSFHTKSESKWYISKGYTSHKPCGVLVQCPPNLSFLHKQLNFCICRASPSWWVWCLCTTACWGDIVRISESRCHKYPFLNDCFLLSHLRFWLQIISKLHPGKLQKPQRNSRLSRHLKKYFPERAGAQKSHEWNTTTFQKQYDKHV